MNSRDSYTWRGAFGSIGLRVIACISPWVLAIVMTCALALVTPGCRGAQLTPEQVIQNSSQKLRQAVSSNVSEEGRKAQMLAVVDQMEAVQGSLSKETADFIRSYRKLNGDYDAPRAAFDQLFSDYNGQRIKARNRALDLHFQLASLASANEWGPIGKAEAKSYEEFSDAEAKKGAYD